MSKDTFWFRHDSNAKDDPKCILLIEQLGPEGYGIFWILIELLREQPEYKYPIKLLPSIARRYNTSTEKIKTVILSYELFEIENDDFFFSESLMKRMEALNEYRNALSEAGRRGAQARLKGGLRVAQASRVDKSGEEKKGDELNGTNVQTFGDSNIKEFLVVKSQLIDSIAYKIHGVDGLSDFMQAHMSILNYPEYAQKFMRNKSGDRYNDLQHLRNAYAKFIEKQ